MRTISKYLIALMALWMNVSNLSAQGWPEKYSGVMLQGFYWDSFDDTQWILFEKQADELAGTFSLVWIPQSANCGGTSMGYDPLYWFPGHYNSSFGTEEQLRSMIKTFKQKGIGTIADVVINHRKNVSNWVDFPKETYNGVTYQMTSTDIVRNDDGGATLKWATDNGYSLSANNDSGEGWDGMRDLDHKSENVQNNVKAYLKMLLEDLGYTGFRYDMVKGYPASYTSMYNAYSKPQFSVGECWDGTSTIRKWIDGTKDGDTPTSAAFDFQFRYTVRNAANNNDWSRLGQQNDGSYPLVSSSYEQGSYRQYAVTFVENHDTEKRSNAPQDPLKKDTLAANAYMLAMPGTPCVFLKHWQAYKQEIKAMVEARKVAGITNTSSYTQMRSAKEYYANLIKTDNENRLIVVVGSNTNGYQPNDQWQEILSGYHYKYYLARKAETAWADKASGSYKEAFSTRLIAVSESDDAQIVYTLDGSEPTSSSKKVSNGTAIPFTEEGDYILKAGLLLSSGEVKGIITRSYTLKEDKPLEFVIPSFCTMGSDEVCAFFEAPVNWTSTIACWAWTNTPSDNFTYSQRKDWPGVDCVKIGTTDEGYDVWKWTWDGTKQNNSSATKPAFIIFSNAGTPQTADLNFQNGGYYTKDGLKGVVSTGIREIPMDVNGKPAAVYSINGMRLPQGTTADQLPRGVYIINGKKVVK